MHIVMAPKSFTKALAATLLTVGLTTSTAFADTTAASSALPVAQLVAEPLPAWQLEQIDTTIGITYLSEQERAVILEINRLRSDPAKYARHYLLPLRAYYQGDLLTYPGDISLVTEEGVAALEECILALERAQPAPMLSPRKGLVLAARDHAADQSRTGETGHTGSDASSMTTRTNRYGKWITSVGENISYGDAEARKIVTALLIDDGVPSRGHRANLLQSGFAVVGVAIATHPVYRQMCVMDFAGDYATKAG